MGVSYFTPLGVDHVLNFLKARSPQALRRLMFRNNAKHKAFVVYQDVQWVESEKSWYVWYYVSDDGFSQLDEMQQQDN